jgi:hypothetical protein
MLLALFGGPSSTLRTIDSILHSAATTVSDFVKAAVASL